MLFFYEKTEQLENAIAYYEKTIAIKIKAFNPEHQSLGVPYNQLGNIHQKLRKYDIAIEYHKKSLSIVIKNYDKNPISVARSYANIGNIYRNTERFDDALEYLNKSVTILKKENHTYGLGIVYNNLGVLYKNKNEYHKALKYFRKSVEARQKLYGNEDYRVANVIMNIGNIYKKLNVEKSFSYYNKALQIYNKTLGKKYSYVARTYHNIGDAHVLKKEYDLALEFFQKSLRTNQLIDSKDHYETVKNYLSIGDVYDRKKEYEQALTYYQEAIALVTNKSLQGNELAPDCYNQIGGNYHKQQKFKESLTYFDKAIESNHKTDKTITEHTFAPKDYYYTVKLFTSLFGKTKTLLDRYHQQSTIRDLDQAIIYFTFLDQIVDYSRKSYQNYEDKVNWAKQTKEMYANAITAQMLHYNITHDDDALRQAFYYSEKSKSNILKDLLLENNAKNFSGLPTEIIQLETELKSNRSFYKSQIAPEQSKDSIDVERIQEYENNLFTISQRQDSLNRLLENKYPKYYQLKHQNHIVSIPEIQQKVDKNTTVIEFFASDSTTYAFVISKNDFIIKELPTPKLRERITTFHQTIVSRNNQEYLSLGHDIYNELIAPIQDRLTGDKIVIIPDGPLWNLNFELLLTQKSTSKNPKHFPYLLKEYAISYSNSATLLFNPLLPEKPKAKQNECLAFSFSDSTNTGSSQNIPLATLRNTKEDLPGTREEIKAIAEIIDGQYYYGSEAVERNFKKNVTNYSILHLALHGEVDDEHPENSRLFFTKDKDTLEDNLLYSHEIFALDIPTELAVLSACNTGTGKIADGEGIMSLGNAFQYAGTKSLLLSSWEVSDKTTPQLMKYFYTNLKDGMEKSKALQHAKLQYLENADKHRVSPFYWGGFYLVGETKSIDLGTPQYWYWILGVFVFIIISFLIYMLLKKRNPNNP